MMWEMSPFDKWIRHIYVRIRILEKISEKTNVKINATKLLTRHFVGRYPRSDEDAMAAMAAMSEEAVQAIRHSSSKYIKSMVFDIYTYTILYIYIYIMVCIYIYILSIYIYMIHIYI